ncbi:NADH-quinone oxidoreductase subunit E [Acetobacteraceae bacterium KSS8]|uniref:NADH-quinone oxidoreductase subunit E n=1 Tax=Endosaccharibacter trunci TaxID=2812733 RepID=A0ABT1W5D2_9PROT|nr:NADH-quinone oxidoreductase subunit E [Acetobacteraceae bacterium KSS8]
MTLQQMAVLPVAIPLLSAALILATAPILPRRMPDVLAILIALCCAGLCGFLADRSAAGPIVTWFGGWTPRGGQPIGIAFVVTPAGGWIAAFIAALFAATLVFSWGFFEKTSAHFHLLMLLFMAGQIGFCLTHDLFNLFVWFELMSVAAFALTGYALRSSALSGALNFTVVNTIGAYLILAGIGLAYSRTGALDFAGIARGVSASPGDPVVVASFCLLSTGLLIKGAQVPFQFWLPDAHSVAHSPVSVIFSGAMVAIALFGIAELYWAVFASAPVVHALMHGLLLGMGTASAALGGVMALLQRHVKRLLAFSTISHAGIMLIGFALLDRQGVSGALVYLVGHGLVKGSLFMGAGILLARLGGADEIGLRGAGRQIWPAGVAIGAGGLLLAGLPLGVMDAGLERIWDAARLAGCWPAEIAICAGLVCTGAAVLRVTGRVFAGLGPVPGEEERSPTEDEREDADRPLWLMLLPVAALLVLAVPLRHDADRIGWLAAQALMAPQTNAILGMGRLHAIVPPPWRVAPHSVLPWIATAAAILVAALQLFWHRLPCPLAHGFDRFAAPALRGLSALQSGRVADYVAWLTAGLALFGVAASFG